MLQKMGGFKVGGGVGKHEQGRVEPVLPKQAGGREKSGLGEVVNKRKVKKRKRNGS